MVPVDEPDIAGLEVFSQDLPDPLIGSVILGFLSHGNSESIPCLHRPRFFLGSGNGLYFDEHVESIAEEITAQKKYHGTADMELP
jgi:hypothetical protein